MTERQTRRAFIARTATLAVGATTLSILGGGSFLGTGFRPTVASAHEVAGNANRAVEIYNAMQKHFYLPDSKLYLETRPQKNGNPYAYVWPFYEALAGTIDMAGIPGIGGSYAAAINDRLAALKFYYRNWSGTTAAAPIAYNESGYDSYPRGLYGPGGDRYNDDNAWIGRALLQLHRMTGGTGQLAGTAISLAGGLTPLQGATDVYRFVKGGWYASPPYPADPQYPNPNPASAPQGGVFWIRSDRTGRPDRDRGAATTGGLAKLALHLRELTNTDSAAYLDEATRAYAWTRANLYRTDKVYADKVLPDGSIDWGVWSYNQGVMVGAGVLLHRATGNTTYLEEAVTTADASLAYFNQHGWYSQPVIFNVLFFRNILMLHAVDPVKYGRFRQATQDFADRVWNDKGIHNKQSHLIKFDPSTSAYKLREQAAMVQIYACLAWDPGSYNKLA